MQKHRSPCNYGPLTPPSWLLISVTFPILFPLMYVHILLDPYYQRRNAWWNSDFCSLWNSRRINIPIHHTSRCGLGSICGIASRYFMVITRAQWGVIFFIGARFSAQWRNILLAASITPPLARSWNNGVCPVETQFTEQHFPCIVRAQRLHRHKCCDAQQFRRAAAYI